MRGQSLVGVVVDIGKIYTPQDNARGDMKKKIKKVCKVYREEYREVK